jgi:hypothetical protein
MPSVTINTVDYPVYESVADADAYLAADFSRAAGWAALTGDDKPMALVSATRLLQRQSWRDGVPDTEAAPQAVADATALLAADIALKPALGDSGSTASNVKAVGAGSAKVEFFRPSAGQVLPSAAYDLLRGLLGPLAGTEDDPALDGTAYGCSPCQRSRFDPTDYGLIGDGTPRELEGW